MPRLRGQHLVICRSQTSNVALGPFSLSGDHIVGLTGNFGGATVTFSHKMPVDNDTANLVALPVDASMVFTSPPAAFPYKCAVDLPLYVTITGASGSTSINCTLFAAGT